VASACITLRQGTRIIEDSSRIGCFPQSRARAAGSRCRAARNLDAQSLGRWPKCVVRSQRTALSATALIYQK
jgi:hypothetical protein